ncbi:MAG: hypothetical protein HY782_24210 [Chloroflexi bacterium]|nr:hypothetical protein [Chloroflexota bacterium]
MAKLDRNDNVHVFILKLWQEESDDPLEAPGVWRGRVQDALQGESYYFTSLPKMLEFIANMVDADPRLSRGRARK